ncbi:MAG: UDP-glucose 4-epimerase, partial [Candidatus Tectomicrobia bacterium]|nr:UDP-glucose 4-epimerase [Candidatus Tectomicrobia bacterium]
MAVLVTGGAGYIGSHTVKLLIQRGYAPVVYDNLIYGHREAVSQGDFVHGHLHDTARLVEVLTQYNITDVLHFAAFAYVGESVQDPLKYYDNNVVGTLSLLQAMRTAGVKHLIFSSTCAVYGVPRQPVLTEDHPL